MPEATIFKNMSLPVENKRIIHLIYDIKSDKYKQEIEQIRGLIADNDKENADLLKKQLPAFTASGTFKNSRKAESLVEYSQILCLDFDKIDPSRYDMAFQKISAIPQTIACFRSPGGNGIKALLEVNTEPDQHEMAYKQAISYYESNTGFPCDPKCKDITRLCFVSYDPDTYINESYKRLFIKPDSTPPVARSSPVTTTPDYQALFSDCISFTEQKSQYIDGNRNNFIYLLASNCNRKGIPEDVALDLIIANFDLSEHEIRASVKSAYNNHSADFAKFANSAKVQTPVYFSNTLNDCPEEDYLKNTEFVPDAVYTLLPDLLKSGSLAFKDLRERDVFLTGALAILSGCLPQVSGVYYQQVVYPNLFSFIIAPAASGKGALKFAKCLGDAYHDQLIQESNEELQRYKTEMNEYKANMYGRKKGEPSGDAPEQPLFRVLYIPANSSYAKILSHLKQNNESGIICETEADTMGNVLKQEWGSYSDMLRKA
ncbi:MAG: BT4734/BF3469 family protein, partial [Bacteroidales bacterium]|nr:BT4734/BF3469 family protein [Bacteroidales bacterium]